MNPEFHGQAQAVADAIFEAMLDLVRKGMEPGAVGWGAASALGNLVEHIVESKNVPGTLDSLAVAMRAAAQARAIMNAPAQGSA